MLLHRLLWDGAERYPDKVAFTWIDRDVSLSYSEAVTSVDQVAGALAGLGVGRGDRVGVFAHNGMDYLLAMFGAWRLGAIAALINVSYADTLDYYVQDAEPSVLIYTHDHHGTIERHRAALGSVKHFVCLDGPQPGSLSWPEIVAAAGPPPADTVEETDVAHLSYTSGTSGNPKGACLAHEPTARATRCIAERLRISSADVSFGPTALSSSYQLVANLLPVLHRHGTACVLGRWDRAVAVEQIEAAGATIVAGNPPVLTDLLHELRSRAAPLAALRLAVSGGGPVPPDLKRAWRDELGLPLAESYGQSELGGFVGLGTPDPVRDDRLDACGPPLPDKEVRIVDDEDRPVPIGQLGEIVIRGGFMSGYWKRPERTAENLRGGWLHTGDVGFLGADDYVHMRGRLSERIVVDGRHWYPRDVEEVLLRHHAIREVAVVGVLAPGGAGAVANRDGRRPVAFVTVATGVERVPAEEILAGLAAELPEHDIGVLTIVVVPAMPMTPTGKIAKAQLADAHASGAIAG